MDERAEKLIVALMTLLEQHGGEIRLDTEAFNRMFDLRHKKGIQVREFGDEGLFLILGDMPVSPDDAMFN